MPPQEPDEFLVDFPTLGYLVADWIQQHCIIPDGFKKGQPYEMADWQLWCTVNHYRVRPDAVWDPDNPRVSTNFFYRASQVVAPQKTGKGPWLASIITCEGLGPTVFCGWAEGGETYECADNDCDCGWVYVYEPGEPMGMRRPSPLIQLTATSRDHTQNVYRPLKIMFRKGGMDVEQLKTGEELIRLPDDGEIATVTSSAKSKLGNPVTFVGWDETGIYTKANGMVAVHDTQARGLAGMDARGIQTTNCWDPAERSTAQMTFESSAKDVFRFYREPPVGLKYTNAADRRKIHRFVYAGSWWVNLDAIEGLAAALLDQGEKAQAERFFGNRRVQGTGAWLPDGAWDLWTVKERTPRKEICLGFDGSTSDDWTVIRAEDLDGYQFTPTYGPDARQTIWNPKEFGGKIPRLEVKAALESIFSRFEVARFYCDPKDWQTEIAEWELLYGEKCVAEWATNRPKVMFDALDRFTVDLPEGRIPHDGCVHTKTHMANARKSPIPGDKYILAKPAGAYHQKIDAAMATVLAHEAACDARAAGWAEKRENFVYY